MIRDIQEIQSLATKYSKQQLAQMAQMGMIDPTKAVMAGMMIKRIEDQNQKPPQTTVAQDVLGAPQQMAMQQAPQQQMPQQPQQMPPQQMPQQPQMAADGGLMGLPAGDVGNYAGGGIVAFGNGGQTLDNEYYGLPVGGRSGSEEYWDRPVMPYGEQMRNVGSSFLRGAKRLFSVPESEAPPAPARPSVAPALDQSAAETARLQRQATIPTPLAPPALPIPAAPSAGGRLPKLDTGVGTAKGITRPTLADFDPNAVTQIKGTDLPEYEKRTLKQIGDLRREAEVAEGSDPKLYEKLIKKIEDKQDKLKTREGEAAGQALMQLGLGLFGAKQGQEAQAVSESGQKALGAYQQSIEKLRDADEKYAERIQALQISDQEAKRTGARADIAQAEADRKAAFDANVKKAEAKNTLSAISAQVGASAYGAKTGAETQRYTAELSAKTQKEIANLNADVQRWVHTRPPAEIQAIDVISQRTGKPFDQAMKDFYGARAGARNMYTREEAMKDARKNLENLGVVNPTDAQMQAEINKQMRIYGDSGGGGSAGGTLQPGPNGTQTYVPRQ